jgi:hypothetical protein
MMRSYPLLALLASASAFALLLWYVSIYSQQRFSVAGRDDGVPRMFFCSKPLRNYRKKYLLTICVFLFLCSSPSVLDLFP